MLELIKNWIAGIAGAAVFCAVMTEITPKSSVKNVVKAICGMVMAIAFVSPLLKLDFDSYSLNMAKYCVEAEKITAGGKEISDSLSRTIIEQKCRTYILDKAQFFGADISDAQVTVKWSSEGYWYPVECRISGAYCCALAGAVEAELGITEEGQIWLNDENT